MATLHQDVWLGEHPRTRGLRLGPFRGARLRLALFPESAAALDDAEFLDFLERLAERVEVVVATPCVGAGNGPGPGESALQEIERRFGSELPLVVVGFAAAAPLALGAAQLPSVRAVALLGVPGIGALLDADPTLRLAAAEKPLLVAVAGDRTQPPSDGIETALTSWPRVCLVLFSGGARAAWRPPWPGMLAEWALATALP